jgi:ribosome recycling factor
MIKELLEDAAERMEQAVSHTQSEFSTLRSGRANPGILHRIMVSYYGTMTPLQQLASISVPEPRMLVVSPFDQSALGEIEKAIITSPLGLSPSNDGHIIRLSFPPLTEERRKELIKLAKHMAEDGRISVRQIRRSTKDDIEEFSGEISDDDIRRAEKDLQDVTDTYTGRIDELLEHKEHELLEV